MNGDDGAVGMVRDLDSARADRDLRAIETAIASIAEGLSVISRELMQGAQPSQKLIDCAARIRFLLTDADMQLRDGLVGRDGGSVPGWAPRIERLTRSLSFASRIVDAVLESAPFGDRPDGRTQKVAR